MLDSARAAVAGLQGKSREAFLADANLRDATIHRIQVVGEAARLVSTATRLAHPDIPWDKITGTRHRIVHEYLNVDLDIVWEVATRHLTSLIAQLTPLVDEPTPE